MALLNHRTYLPCIYSIVCALATRSCCAHRCRRLLAFVRHSSKYNRSTASTSSAATTLPRPHRSSRMTTAKYCLSTDRTGDAAVPTKDGAVAAAVHIYPYGTTSFDPNIPYKATKMLHLIRHAEGTHNVNQRYRDIANLDARLTERGIQQCRALSNRIRDAAAGGRSGSCSPLSDLATETDLIVTSPLTRCIQTTLLSLDHAINKSDPSNSTTTNSKSPPVVLVYESVRETVNFNCDRRRDMRHVMRDFDHAGIDFSHIASREDAIWDAYVDQLGCDQTWTQHRESAELHVVADRGRDFFQWLSHRPERHVVVCTHSAFLRCIKNFGLDDTVPHQPPQILVNDTTCVCRDPVLQFRGDDAFRQSMRSDYANCELRSMVVAFPA
jgi:broad specificity phosphatase PhoE